MSDSEQTIPQEVSQKLPQEIPQDLSHDPRDAIFAALHEILRSDPNAFLLTNDMGALGVDHARKAFPDRVLNLGIAEQNLISVAAGLALSGKTVFTWGILSHMTARCYEQLRLDVAASRLPVIGLTSGAGLAYGVDGPTHHGLYDLAPLRGIPGMAIWNPADATTAFAAVRLAWESRAPTIIRLDKETPPPLMAGGIAELRVGLRSLRPGADITLVATGVSVLRALAAAEMLANDGIEAEVIDFHRLAPVPEEAVAALLDRADSLLTVEEHTRIGGLASLMAEKIAEHPDPPRFRALAMPDAFFLGAMSRAHAERVHGLGPSGIHAAASELVASRPARRSSRRKGRTRRREVA